MARRVFGENNDPAPEAQRLSRTTGRPMCCAHNCPLIATISLSPSSEPDRCRFHQAESEMREWPAITARMHKLGWLLSIHDAAITADPYRWERGLAMRARERCEERGRPELAPMVRETRFGVEKDERVFSKLYAERINSVLMAEVISRTPQREAPAPQQQSTGPTRAGELLASLNSKFSAIAA